MTDYVKVCELAALTDGEALTVELDEQSIAVARVGDVIYAIDDTCSHAKVSLGDGIVEGDDRTIECPKHGALFSLVDGAALTLPATRGVQPHNAEARDDGIYVQIRSDSNE